MFSPRERETLHRQLAGLCKPGGPAGLVRDDLHARALVTRKKTICEERGLELGEKPSSVR